jgi:ankyrin repeat protein
LGVGFEWWFEALIFKGGGHPKYMSLIYLVSHGENLMVRMHVVKRCILSFSVLLATFLTPVATTAFPSGDDFGLISQAIDEGDANKVLQLLLSGISPNVHNKHGITPLMEASRQNRADIISLLLKYGANANAKNSSDVTALHYAFPRADVKSVEMLLDAGADVNAKTDGGTTPLMEATGNGKTAILKLLLSRGADVNLQDASGKTALMCVYDTPGWADIALLLIKAGADVNLKDERGRTALMHAIWSLNISVVKILIETGADVNAISKEGFTPLSLAKRRVDGEKIEELLLRAGATR